MTDPEATPEAIKPTGKPKPKPAPKGRPVKDKPAPATKPKGRDAKKADEPAAPVVAPVRITNITVDETLQPRAGKLDEQHVADIQEAYKAKRPVPPVVVYKTAAGEMILSQGFHRLRARQLSGHGFIDAEIRTGERLDATIDALSSNQGHGLRRTTADKRRAIGELLKVCPKWSDRRIADQLGVDGGTVGTVRAELAQKDASVAPPERETASGQTRKATPAKPKAAAKPAADKTEPAPAPISPGPEATASAPLEATSAPADDGSTLANTDALGLRIPADLMPAFEARGAFEDLVDLLRQARVLVTYLGNHAGGQLLLKRLQWIRADNKDGGRWSLGDLDNALTAVEDSAPKVADCPYKYAEGDHDGCKLCHGSGFTGDLKHRQVPAELVAKMKAARAAEADAEIPHPVGAEV